MSTPLRVVVPPRIAPAYRLAGAQVDEVEDAAEARAAVAALVRQHEGGVIAVHEPFFHELPARWRSALDPLLVAIPERAHRAEPGSRRARLTAMLEQVIGYHIDFREEQS